MTKYTRRILLLYSDTGGGHRSSARAVVEALRRLYGDRAQAQLVDGFSDYAPWPFSRASDTYPYMVRMGGIPWAAGWHLLDGPRRTFLLSRSWWPLMRSGVVRLLRECPADVIVSCHPFLNHPVWRALIQTETDTPMITLVTDLIAAHSFWFTAGANRYLVPTEGARRRALDCGIPAERIVKTGLPVSQRFVRAAQEDQSVVRRRLGLEVDQPTVLLVSGAEGMGSPYRLSTAVAESGIDAQLVIVAGRNERLRARLSSESWPMPVRVEGFVQNMHEWMRAADLLVTKAGPSTISEAMVMGLPMVLSDALPGQERPNVDYVVEADAGVWAPTPEQVAKTVHDLLTEGNPRLAEMAAHARALAQPDAAQSVARIVWEVAGEEIGLPAGSGQTDQPSWMPWFA